MEGERQWRERRGRRHDRKKKEGGNEEKYANTCRKSGWFAFASGS